MVTFLFRIAECCKNVQVIANGTVREEFSDLPSIFSIENYLINGNVHYTSLDGSVALNVDSNGNWLIHDALDR